MTGPEYRVMALGHLLWLAVSGPLDTDWCARWLDAGRVSSAEWCEASVASGQAWALIDADSMEPLIMVLGELEAAA